MYYRQVSHLLYLYATPPPGTLSAMHAVCVLQRTFCGLQSRVRWSRGRRRRRPSVTIAHGICGNGDDTDTHAAFARHRHPPPLCFHYPLTLPLCSLAFSQTCPSVLPFALLLLKVSCAPVHALKLRPLFAGLTLLVTTPVPPSVCGTQSRHPPRLCAFLA